VSKAIDANFGAEREKVPNPNPKAKQQNASINTNDYGDYNAVTEIAPIPATEAAKEWDGWGTALKPATEFWTLARKPLIGTVAENILEHGCGGLNINGSRIGFESEADKDSATWGRGTDIIGGNYVGATHSSGKTNIEADAQGRWPANVIFDAYTAYLLDIQTGRLTSGQPSGLKNASNNIYGEYGTGIPVTGYGDSGGASRFFYVAKPSPEERNRGLRKFEKKEVGIKNDSGRGFSESDPYKKIMRQNVHPTVKPITLMQYLVKLITPPGGTCLDPFNGSGTTGIACKIEGFNYVGFDREQEYIDISIARAAAFFEKPKTLF
jgi:site-specific DNA-methyltransferase (adenine-specific)